MLKHNLPQLFVALMLALFVTQVSQAQYVISTVAGGGPKNLTALSVATGYPASVAVDKNGNTYIADSYSSNILEVAPSGNVTIVAGNGTVCPQTAAQCGDGGPATSAALNHPEGVFVDGSGNIFIADSDNNVIRAVNTGSATITIAGVVIQPGNIATVAGNGTFGYSGDGGPAIQAQLYDPNGVFVDSSGNIFIADTDNCLIRKVSGSNISTVAGNPLASPSPCGFFGDGGLATSAQLAEPQGVFVDAAGNIFIADTDNSVIRKVTIANGNIQTLAGTYYDFEATDVCQYSGDSNLATAAFLCLPSAVFVDSSGNIFIADTYNLVVREVVANTGDIETVAGNNALGAGYSGDGGAATSAQLNYPNDIAVDPSGDIFIADTDNFVIREVTASNSQIQTVTGNNTLAFAGDSQPATNAELNYPQSVFVDNLGDIFIADTDTSVVREIVAASGIIQTVAGNALLGAGYTGDGAPATNAQLNNPGGVFVDSLGNIFIADSGNSVIREVLASSGNIMTVAGNGTPGYLGDGALAVNAELSNPYGVFVDSAENIFIADTDNQVIREVTSSNGFINTVAGNGVQCVSDGAACGDGGPAKNANLGFPLGVFVDVAENIYIADSFDQSIRAVAGTQQVTIAGVAIQPGNIATVAGTTGLAGYSGDGAASTLALLNDPNGLFVDSSGDIFIADTANHVIREVVAASGFIQTVAGNGTPGFSGDGGQSTGSAGQTSPAELYFPYGVFGTSAGNLFIADTGNQRIRELVPSIFVSVTPNPVNVAVSSQQQFTAAVTGITNTAVTWQVNGVAGGNASTTGAISATGLYQAPATIPTPATVTITAIASDGTTSGSAQATIVSVDGAVMVTVTTNPVVTQVYTSTLQIFIATVTGTTNAGVNWQVNGAPSGNTTFGTIDASGNYTAPTAVPNPATVTIEAVSQALSSAIGSDTITIVTEPSAAEPAPQVASPGGTATYSLLLNENTGAPGQAIKLSCSQSSLPVDGTCSFTPSTITPGAQAVPFSLTITIPAGAAGLDRLNRKPLHLFFAFAPLVGILFVGAGRRNKRHLWVWLVGLCILLMLLNACGGAASSSTPSNPELGTYNVKVLGTTSAQPNPVTITVAGLTVQ
jgi:protein gp37/sugar lactone lactonase YvrE